MSKKLKIEATINAPLEQVWQCWNGAEHITQWNFASDDWHCPSAENDLRVGGRCKSRMEAKDGSFGFDMEYTYTRVEPYSVLEYQLDDGREIVTTFAVSDGATKVVTEFDPETEHPLEMQQQGWQSILNNFKAYVEAA